MSRRIIIVFFLFVLCVGALGVRLMQVPIILPAQSAHGAARVVVDRSRGAIYDRNGARLVQGQRQVYAAVKPSPAANMALRSVLSGERFAAAEERMARGNLIALPVDDPVPPCPDILLLDAWPRYAPKQPAAHIIGYLDGQTGTGISGIEKAFDPILGGTTGELSVRMMVDVHGRGLGGAALEAESENYRSPAGVQLTIDARVQRIAEEALALHNVEQGAAVVLDCRTGEILALASVPAFDPNRIALSLDDPLEPFVNRALWAYPMGSSFKCFVAAAALEQRIPASTQYFCGGAMDVSGQTYHCSNGSTHGMVDMTAALAQSCNLYFIQLAREMQLQPALDLLRLFGFGEGTQLAPGIIAAHGNMTTIDDLALPGELANFSFGQGKLLGTPLQIAAATACLAGDGVYHSPTLVTATLDAFGVAEPYVQDMESREVISPGIAAQVRRMMVAAVETGTGNGAMPETGGAGGKTATAQSGHYALDGTEILQTGFTGFFPAEEPRYAVTVFRQNGTSGAGDCGPVFQRIANAMTALGL